MLHLSYSDYAALRAHGEENYPHECCGVLLGNSTPEGNQVREIVRAGNTRTDRAHDRYNIAPEELIRIQSGPVVADRLCRGALGRLLLRHHARRPGQGRRHQLLPAHRHERGRQEVPRRTGRDCYERS